MIDSQQARDLSRPEDLIAIRAFQAGRSVPLTGRKEVIAIFGANSGIGLGMSRSLLLKGFCVAALDSSRENLLHLQEKFPNLLALRCDFARDEEIKEALDLIVRKWGAIDVLVSNLTDLQVTSLEALSVERSRECLEKNFLLPLKVLMEVLPQMENQGKGLVHLIVSAFALAGLPGLHPIIFSHSALEALSRSLDIESRKGGVRVNLMCDSIFTWRSSGDRELEAVKVGEKLAREILTEKPIVTPDLATNLCLSFARRFPYFSRKAALLFFKLGIFRF